MRIPLRLLSLATLTLLLAAPAAAQGAADYPQLLARFQAGDTTVDVTALRRAYTETEMYSPYDRDSQVQVMWEELDRDRFSEAAAAAEQVLAKNWLNIAAHVGAMVAYDELGNDSAAALHALSVRRLVDSVGGPDDGRTQDAPMWVIDTTEEYAYLNVYGLRFVRQSLANCGEVRCDILEVTDEDGNRFSLYFDITVPFGWLGRQMGQGGEGEAPAAGARP